MNTQHEIVAKRYERALTMLAGEKGSKKNVLSDLESVVKLLTDNKQLFDNFKSPAFSSFEKGKVLNELAKKLGLSGETFSFLKLLNEKGRMEVLPEVFALYRENILSEDQTIEVQLETAMPLDDAQLEKIVTSLEKATSLKVLPVVSVKSDLVAGIRVNFMGKTLDSSLNANLEYLKQKLLRSDA